MNVTLLGLGIIGQVWADNLAADGIPLKTWNRTSKERPDFVSDLTAAVTGASHILLVVSDAPAVAGIVARIAPLLRPGQIVIQSSTLSPEAVRAAAAVVTATGARFLDAPFTGSKPAAEQRQTVFYIGGDEETVNDARPLLERLSKAILHIGPEIGCASALKLAMNLNIAELAQALSESLTLARLAGISDETYFHALKLNLSHSGIATLKEPALRSREYTPQFSVKHMFKDLRQAQELAGERRLPQLDRLLEVYRQGVDQGLAERDFISLIHLLE